jgi:hypothetical protein
MPRKGEQQLRQLAFGKYCSRCLEWKSLEEFSERAEMVDGRRSSCRECERQRNTRRRESDPEGYIQYKKNWYQENKPQRSIKMRAANLRRLYGISVQQYDVLLANQGGLCAICRKVPTRKRLCVDHDHETGQVRGLLCDNCNTGIAMLKESEEILHSAIAYLSHW